MREKLFSITSKDFDWVYYRGHGKGGQHRNTTDSAVRCTHKASKAVATSQDERSQRRNKIAAFKRVVETKEFKAWLKIECAKYLREKVLSDQEIQIKINEELEDPNITIVEYI